MRGAGTESRIGWIILGVVILLNIFGGGRTWALVAAAVGLVFCLPFFVIGWRKDREARQTKEREGAVQEGH